MWPPWNSKSSVFPGPSDPDPVSEVQCNMKRVEPYTFYQGDLHVTWGGDSSAVVTLSSVRFESTQTLGNLSSQPIAACRAPAAARSPSHPGPRGAARCAALGARTAPPGRNSWGERCGGARLNALFRKPALAVDRRREGARLVPFFGDGQS